MCAMLFFKSPIEKDCIVTTRDLLKDYCILACKIGRQIHAMQGSSKE